jgi:hypothetical protein
VRLTGGIQGTDNFTLFDLAEPIEDTSVSLFVGRSLIETRTGDIDTSLAGAFDTTTERFSDLLTTSTGRACGRTPPARSTCSVCSTSSRARATATTAARSARDSRAPSYIDLEKVRCHAGGGHTDYPRAQDVVPSTVLSDAGILRNRLFSGACS